jgi:hypothetical protein
MKLYRLLISATILTLMFSFLAVQTPALAATGSVDLVTKGDVIKILYGRAKADTMESYQRAAITPLASHDGAHFCVDDWHIVRVSDGENIDYVTTFTKKQVIEDLKRTNVTLYLDGVVISSTRAPIFTTIADDGTTIWWFQTGSILSPKAISVGEHTAGVLFSDPAVYPDEFHSSTFTVDPSGSGVCLQD